MNLLSKLSTLFGQSSANAVSSATASRSVARERLSVILASQRGSEILDNVDMAKFQNDVMEVVRKHIKLAKNEPVSFQVKQEGNVNLFEMQVELDEEKKKNAFIPKTTNS
mmetsp:Transcript_12269/g.17674  ORF Transcript_12269/g.17674 Transcript_12269/m.17674 type:complete len:110 (+) Transcript_12269:77-406(+)|eukprot:CAMPEP_0172414628 /NCGR_PEP_ID=MMETSP1064-20121228/1274_1 /TAXON_ID=202472 /ORGANISM="Aulacoseira subarctica , Strain CCAP 1002/5" /LENGTH=109 /DNA_ID=CAMNT_0013151389 /DNA_START=77 /DNA_END=406 /DNA_ORIENTATION=+